MTVKHLYSQQLLSIEVFSVTFKSSPAIIILLYRYKQFNYKNIFFFAPVYYMNIIIIKY